MTPVALRWWPVERTSTVAEKGFSSPEGWSRLAAAAIPVAGVIYWAVRLRGTAHPGLGFAVIMTWLVVISVGLARAGGARDHGDELLAGVPESFLRRPPMWEFHMYLVPVVGMHLLAVSYPAGNSVILLLTGMGWLALGAVWLFRMATYGIAAGCGRATGDHRWCLLAPAVFMLVYAGAHNLELPLQLRFALSRDALDGVVEECLDHRVVDEDCDDGPLGLYTMSSVRQEDGGVVFVTRNSGPILQSAGFAWFPDQPSPAFIRERHTEPLGDGWYEWWWR